MSLTTPTVGCSDLINLVPPAIDQQGYRLLPIHDTVFRLTICWSLEISILMVDSLRSIQPFHTTLRYRGSTTWWYLNPDFGLQGDTQPQPSRATLLEAHASTSESSECLEEANVCRVGIPIHIFSDC
jgi:hypothetical protein